jgi:uncharacterized membrane protein YeaQ/YmgE (transglycosylase-associated protein family)
MVSRWAIGSGDIFELNIFGSIVAIVSAVVLLAIAEAATAKRR